MADDDLARRLAQIEDAMTHRVAVWRVIVNAERQEVGRIFRGYIHRDPSVTREPDDD